MSFRSYLDKLKDGGRLAVVKKPVSQSLEAANAINAFGEKPVIFEKIRESQFRVAGNVFATKALVAEYLSCSVAELIPRMANAINNPTKPNVVERAACQEVVEDVDLDRMPILLHLKQDGGRYVSSGVMIAKDKELGQNVSFHRAMQIGKDRFAIRVLERHTHEFLKRNDGQVDACFCVGCGANVLIAGATSVRLGQDELEIANALEPLDVVKAKTMDVLVPADAEWILEGTLTMNEPHTEGPFLDLTETLDTIREEPIFIVRKITHRKDAIWHALLPGGLEHKILMGMPREPTIFNEVCKVCKCLDVNVNPGGCSWLHAIVQIDKQHEDDGKKAAEAAFRGHSSLKHAFVVDKDIDIYNPLDVEWAMATRFQFDRCVVPIGRQPGSSLDPSSEPGTKLTMKVGFDLTKPLAPPKGKDYSKVKFPAVKKEDYL